jgi:IS605 OrfB family transposase
MCVKLVATVKLLVSPEERERLLATMRRVNEACTWLAERVFALQTADKLKLQKLYYRELRDRFGLSSQHTVRTISKVCEVYKRDKARLPIFKPLGAIPYDQRIYTFKNGLDRVSLLALDGRMVVPCAIGAYHRGRLDGVRGQADLVYRKGKLYLFVTVDVPDGSPIDPEGWLGVDLGIRNLAFDSDGEAHSGEAVLANRSRIAKLRSGLQSAGTKSAKRHLRKLRRREQGFHAHTNHVISKSIVRKAKDTGRGIAVEDLTGIRDRVTVRKAQRATLHSWSFFQLRSFLAYKAVLAGVALVAVDPRNTSRTCPECGNIDKANRRSQAEFVCTGCGFVAHADHVGARNIASRGPVIGPIVSDVRLGIGEQYGFFESSAMPGTKPRPLGRG